MQKSEAELNMEKAKVAYEKSSRLARQIPDIKLKGQFGFWISKKRLFNDLHDLNDSEKVLYQALWLHKDGTGYCYPSMRYLGYLLNHDKDFIQKVIWQLEKKKYIKIIKRWGKKGKAFGYFILNPLKENLVP